jgi:hypothetical protein
MMEINSLRCFLRLRENKKNRERTSLKITLRIPGNQDFYCISSILAAEANCLFPLKC